jgi:hypothetical protein
MDFYRNRFLVDYCQHIIYNLLLRTDGAPFIGTGEKYFSIIDDTEVEIIKCVWEHPDTYIKIPPARRLWHMELPELGVKTPSPDNPSYYSPDFSYKQKFINLTKNMLEALDKLENIKDTADILVFNRLERATFFMLALQMKNWKKVYFCSGYDRAFTSLKSYLAKFPAYESYVQSIELLDYKDDICDINFISEPCIVICNETETSQTKIIGDSSIPVISYNGRI